MKCLILLLALVSCFGVAMGQDIRAGRQNFSFTSPRPGYFDASQQALKENKPLIIYVNVFPYQMSGVVTYTASSFEDAGREAVIVGVPHQGSLYRADLHGTATPGQILAAVERLKTTLNRLNQQSQPQRVINCTTRG